VVQRLDLGLLLADRREHKDRHLAPLAKPSAQLDAVVVGQQQIDDRQVRPCHGGAIERLLGGRGDQDLVAGLAQDQAECAPDLGVVVADENPLGSHHAPGGRSSGLPTLA
jgi:hypothetical protein